ncbi:MAG: hypothetical protein ACTIM4_06955 [Marinomonas sp.]
MNTIFDKNVWNRVKLSQEAMQQGKTKTKNGAKISVFLSPTDVPYQMRTFINKNDDAIIEFKYLSSDEPTKQAEEQDGVTITLGKRSGKIYQVQLSKSLLENNNKFELELAFEVAEHSVENLQNSNNKLREGNVTAIANYLKSLAGSRNQLAH